MENFILEYGIIIYYALACLSGTMSIGIATYYLLMYYKSGKNKEILRPGIIFLFRGAFRILISLLCLWLFVSDIVGGWLILAVGGAIFLAEYATISYVKKAKLSAQNDS